MSSRQRTIQFFWSTRAADPKLHASLGCDALRWLKVSYFPPARYDESEDEYSPSNLSMLPPDLVTEKGLQASLRPLYECRPRTYRGKTRCGVLGVSKALSISAVIAHSNRPCRNCAMELVVDLASREGKRDTPVTFSGQYQPDEGGVDVFEWDNVTQSGDARLVRIAERLGLDTIRSASGTVAYGLVTPKLASVLDRNVRSYRLEGELATFCQTRKVSNEQDLARGRQAIEMYWMLRNHRPPEINEGDVDLARLATVIAR
jgi:hypothetical protein